MRVLILAFSLLVFSFSCSVFGVLTPYPIQAENLTFPCDCVSNSYIGTWKEAGRITNLPPRSGISNSVGGTVGDNLYVVGGIIGPLNGNHTFSPFVATQVRIYNVKTDTWGFGNEMPQRVFNSGSAVVGNDIYVVGGILNNSSGQFESQNTLLKYDTTKGTWEVLSSMAFARSSLSVCSSNGFVYAIGGVNSTDSMHTPLRWVERYNVALNSWEVLAPLPLGRASSAVACFQDRVVLNGGWVEGNSNSPVRSTLVYNILNNTWTLGSPGLVASSASAYADNGQDLLVFGGLSRSQRPIYEVHQFESENNDWYRVNRLPLPLVNSFASSFMNEWYFLFGGNTCRSSAIFSSNRFYVLYIPKNNGSVSSISY